MLQNQPDTPQGRRDTLLMCLLLDHGLRCGEVARLMITDLDLKTGELIFYRSKVDLVQRHLLTADTFRAAKVYFEFDVLAKRPLLRGSRKSNLLREIGDSWTWCKASALPIPDFKLPWNRVINWLVTASLTLPKLATTAGVPANIKARVRLTTLSPADRPSALMQLAQLGLAGAQHDIVRILAVRQKMKDDN